MYTVCLCTLRIVPFVCILDLFKSSIYGWILIKFFTKLDTYTSVMLNSALNLFTAESSGSYGFKSVYVCMYVYNLCTSNPRQFCDKSNF